MYHRIMALTFSFTENERPWGIVGWGYQVTRPKQRLSNNTQSYKAHMKSLLSEK